MANPAKPAATTRGRTAPPQQHNGRKHTVLASAQVGLFQVQLIGTDGLAKAVLVYQCGSDMFWGKSMDDVFSIERRKVAPDWLRKGLAELPATRQFLSDGTPVLVEPEEAAPVETRPAPSGIAQG